MKIAINTLGCKLNQAESSQIAESLVDFGFSITNSKYAKADLYIINTCSVTQKAERESRQAVYQIKNRDSHAKILVTGCCQIDAPEVTFLKNKEKIVDIIVKEFGKQKFKQSVVLHQYKDTAMPLVPSVTHWHSKNLFNLCLKTQRTRALVKIQDGCDNFCTYCIIPYVRGKPKSIPACQIVKDIKKKESFGFKEIVLTGVNIGKYEDGKLGLVDLVKRILKETQIPRIRFSSINPEFVNDKFISLFEENRICQHLHLSLQSGSNAVLRRMRRNYTTQQYLNIVQKIYRKFPDFGFTTDIIVGFPAESENEFKETCDFVKKIGFLKIHIFRYSRRQNTCAAKMCNQISEEVKRKRATRLEQLNKILKAKFQKKMLGKKSDVLFEIKRGSRWLGFTSNYLRVKQKSNYNLKNQIKNITIFKDNLVD